MSQGLMPKSWGKCPECQVIMLGSENLEILKGYKAEVTKNLSVLPDAYPHHHASITVTITGLSNKAAKALFDSLKQLPPEEITELIKRKGFHFNESLNHKQETEANKQ
jgi:hypothetical protein